MRATAILDLAELREAMARELDARRVGGDDSSYALSRGGPEALYGITGAVNIMAALGLPMGDRSRRERLAARILACRRPDGTFLDMSGPGHALHMVLGALNLLGEPIPVNIGPLAPTDPDALRDWLLRHDWKSTHKELSGQTIPLLASGMADARWVETFRAAIEARLDPEKPLETWCAANAPAWQVVSCIYHILNAFDAGRIPYPQPERLLGRLLDLHWHETDSAAERTDCTDGDWAWLLLRLGEHLPDHMSRIMAAIRAVSARRVRAWQEAPDAVFALGTHHLYCYLWSTAVFQSCVRDHYAGGFLRDTLNEPALFRL